nr:hypothetical protein [Streptomyces shenzhenensis]
MDRSRNRTRRWSGSHACAGRTGYRDSFAVLRPRLSRVRGRTTVAAHGARAAKSF